MRVKDTFRNSIVAVLAQVILIVVGFFSRRVLNLVMGKELVGVNGVISNVINLLSVTELGISTAIVYHLYAAVESEDESRIAALMNFYRRAYHVFACVITLIGLPILAVIPMFVKDSGFSDSFIRLIYGIWLARTVLSYLLSYRRSLLVADQKQYIVSIATFTIDAVNHLLCIAILLIWHQYVPVLVMNLAVEVAVNLWLNRYVEQKYPYLRRDRKGMPQKAVFSRIIADVKNIFVTRVSTKLLTCTDNLIISGLISAGAAGLYCNYSMITQSVINVTQALANAIQPGIGHMFLEKDVEKNRHFLRQLTFLFFLIASVVLTCLNTLMTPFVTDLWLGDGYALSDAAILIFSVNTAFLTLTLPLSVMMGVSGLFQRERVVAIGVAVVNLAVSLALVKPFGIAGVMAGTLASYLIQFVLRYHYFFREFVHLDGKGFAMDMLQYVGLAAAEMAAVKALCGPVYGDGGILRFLLLLGTAALLPCLVNYLIFRKSRRYTESKQFALEILHGMKKKA